MPRHVSLDEFREFTRNSKGSGLNIIYCHWSASPYYHLETAYHACIDADGNIYVAHELSETVAATWQRNTGSVNISMLCCRDAVANSRTSVDFGSEPPTTAQIETMAKMVCVVCEELGIGFDINGIRTHAEQADVDHYGIDDSDPDMRWDLLLLPDTDGVLKEGGDVIRGMAKKYHETGDFGTTGTVDAANAYKPNSILWNQADSRSHPGNGHPTSNKTRKRTSTYATDTVTGQNESVLNSDHGITSFAQFATSLAFLKSLEDGFTKNGQRSLHGYLSDQLTKFYHQIYYIPNLQNLMCMVVKPETLFIQAPSCNLIFPNMKSSLSYSRQYKTEPTRLLMVTNPIVAFSKETGSDGPTALYSLVWMTEEPMPAAGDTTAWEKNGEDKVKIKGVAKIDGLPRYAYSTIGMDILTTAEQKQHPMQVRSTFEDRNGIRTLKTNKGADIYLFLAAGQTQEKKAKLQLDDTSSTKSKNIASTLAKLAKYELCRARYASRVGSMEMVFNPYIVPGFPCISFETSEEGLNIYGYVTNVAHNLSYNGWSTTVTFNSAHGDDEETPLTFPIIEEGYTTELSTTYEKMLGNTVSPVDDDDIDDIRKDYVGEAVPLGKCYSKVWRNTPTLEEYCETIADGATITKKDGYFKLTSNGFFKTDIQERIEAYTQKILEGNAFSLKEVN